MQETELLFPTQRTNSILANNNFARRFLLSGGNLLILSKILGHSSVNVTEQAYLDLQDEDLKRKYQNYSPLMNLRK